MPSIKILTMLKLKRCGMNETIRVIKSRRSIRRFKPDPVPDHVLQEILECAICDPSARNQQKWHFTVVQNREVINKMENIMRENLKNSGVDFLVKRASEPDFTVFGNAPVVVIITADKQAFSNFAEIDCAAAAENMMIAAESLGLGSHIMTSTEFLFKSEAGETLRKELGIPDGYKHVCTVALGYKDESPPPKPKKRT
jgi:nitroreductase